MFLSKLGYSELVQRLFEKNDIFSCEPPTIMAPACRLILARSTCQNNGTKRQIAQN